MDPGGISVERTLPIDGVLLEDVLLRLRRDSPVSALRWTLGTRGAAEIDVCFAATGPAWTTGARLWNPTGMAVTTATLRLVATSADEVHMTLEPTVPSASEKQSSETAELAQATADEFAEELLWHATRARLAPRG